MNQTESERCLAVIDTQGDLSIIPNPGLPNAQIYKICKFILVAFKLIYI